MFGWLPCTWARQGCTLSGTWRAGTRSRTEDSLQIGSSSWSSAPHTWASRTGCHTKWPGADTANNHEFEGNRASRASGRLTFSHLSSQLGFSHCGSHTAGHEGRSQFHVQSGKHLGAAKKRSEHTDERSWPAGKRSVWCPGVPSASCQLTSSLLECNLGRGAHSNEQKCSNQLHGDR